MFCYIPLSIGIPAVATGGKVVEATFVEVKLFAPMVVEPTLVVVALRTPMVVIPMGDEVEAVIPTLIDTGVVTAVGKQI